MEDLVIPTGQWTFWYMNKPATRGHIAPSNYESHIHELVTVDTVHSVCSALSHISLPSCPSDVVLDSSEQESDHQVERVSTGDSKSSPSNIDLHFFRRGIKPTWEDTENSGGGRFFIRLRKGLAARFFEWLVLALCSPDHQDWSEQVCGVVLSSRYSEDLLAVWCKRSASQSEFLAGAVRERLRGVLQLPAAHPIEFKPHEQSMRTK